MPPRHRLLKAGQVALEHLRDLRERMVASPRFRRWAARFPLTRPIARRHARELFDLCAGFVYSQVLLACVRLGLFELLLAGPRPAAELAVLLDLPLPAATRLLEAAAALRLLDKRRGDRYALGPLGAALIGNPGLAAMVEHHALFYADLQDPVALLRRGTPGTGMAGYWPYAGAAEPAALSPAAVAPYTALMAASQSLVAEEVLAAYRFDRHRCLLDVGGGDGSFLRAVAATAPRLQLKLFDLPAVAERARARFAESGLAGRAEAVGGDFLRDPLPTGADIISLVRVIHDHNDAAALAILRSVHAALPHDGTLLLAEPMAEAAGAEPMGAAYFGFYLLAMGSGRPRTPLELKDLLAAAGFTGVCFRPTGTPLLTGVLTAHAGAATLKTVSLN